ncbi:WRKY DNA-binding transcription factor 70-like [Impatiens glandulifera]|uniref:WRKY DNA-binding transcription factor 70-like n=1 Tax=Impatiens glandulifera TaxID=253017 RepID=UPI001FB05630|nr:WRKY DNA-binding transcription factor 70-like [Impatiens glandulifera]
MTPTTDSPPPESSEFDPQRVIQELVKGREVALKLQSLLGSNLDDPHQLVANILGSFVNTISMLNRKPEDSPPTHHDVKPEESEESIKTSSSSLKARRGCHPRRKSSESWVKMSGSLRDDGYHWRKYGQKSILNSKHPRSYFRCTHKYEQGCQATKQVQQLEKEERSPMFRTTYYGHHTCKTISPTQIDFHEEIDHDHLPTTTTSSSSPFLLSFDQSQSQSQSNSPNSNVIINQQLLLNHHQMLVKVEHRDQSQQDLNYQLPPSSATSFDHDYLSSSPSSNLTTFDEILPELDIDSMVGVIDYFDNEWFTS